ncbi:MAG: hypothetical protein HZC49_11790, partial [Nitrospirae bacterium]|nr:hypothetical protein [Nitrospirota bacterium]
LVNIVMWIVGLRFIEISVIEPLGYKEMIELVSKMGWIVLVVFLIFRSWGFYNYKRFGKRSRRMSSPPVTIEHLAEHFQIPVEQVKNMQLQKEIVWNNPGLSEASK